MVYFGCLLLDLLFVCSVCFGLCFVVFACLFDCSFHLLLIVLRSFFDVMVCIIICFI